MLKSEVITMERLSYTGRTVLTGRSGSKRAWGILDWEGQTEETMGELPDGRSVWEALNTDGISSLPACWMRITNTGAFGDVIWSDAMIHCFVSERFVSVLEDAGFDGYELLPLEARPKRGERFSGYALLLPKNDDPESPIRSFPFVYRPTVSLDVSAEVMAVLAAAGVTDFESKDADSAAAELLEGAMEDAEDA